jgi:hypothetical protein
MATAREDHVATTNARGQRTVVVDSDDLCVAVVSPNGETVVPLDEERLLSVESPLLLDECWLLVETEEFDGIGATGVVVDWVVEELDDELCARATPVISVTAIVTARKVLIIVWTPGDLERERRSLTSRLANWRARSGGNRFGNYAASLPQGRENGCRGTAVPLQAGRIRRVTPLSERPGGRTSGYWWGDSIGSNNAVCGGCGSVWD